MKEEKGEDSLHAIRKECWYRQGLRDTTEYIFFFTKLDVLRECQGEREGLMKIHQQNAAMRLKLLNSYFDVDVNVR